MIAPFLLLIRSVSVLVQPSGRAFVLQIIILNEQDEEIPAVWLLARQRVLAAAHINPIVVAGVDIVAGIPAHVGTAIKSVEARTKELVNRLAHLSSRNRQGHLDGFRPGIGIGRRNSHVTWPKCLAPYARQLAHIRVGLKVVSQDDSRVAGDVLIAGVTRSDPDIGCCCCWRGARNQ